MGGDQSRKTHFFVCLFFLVFINNTFLPLLCGELDEKKLLGL